MNLFPENNMNIKEFVWDISWSINVYWGMESTSPSALLSHALSPAPVPRAVPRAIPRAVPCASFISHWVLLENDSEHQMHIKD